MISKNCHWMLNSNMNRSNFCSNEYLIRGREKGEDNNNSKNNKWEAKLMNVLDYDEMKTKKKMLMIMVEVLSMIALSWRMKMMMMMVQQLLQQIVVRVTDVLVVHMNVKLTRPIPTLDLLRENLHSQN